MLPAPLAQVSGVQAEFVDEGFDALAPEADVFAGRGVGGLFVEPDQHFWNLGLMS